MSNLRALSTIMLRHILTGQFPIWDFLNQPVFHPNVKLILNPNQFSKHHQREFLERCWYLVYQESKKYPHT